MPPDGHSYEVMAKEDLKRHGAVAHGEKSSE